MYVGNETVESADLTEGRTELALLISYPTSASAKIFLLETTKKMSINLANFVVSDFQFSHSI